jgi:DNA-binding NarL/FixJ family response regulator
MIQKREKMNKKIKLMLVDDHEVVRQGLISLFESYPEFEIVAQASNGKEALDKAYASSPDVILMDGTMPIMDGFEATKIITQECPDCRVLALTVHEDKEFMIEMMVAGACGFVTKRALADDVVDAIRVVANGGLFLSPYFANELVQEFRNLYHGVEIGNRDNPKENDQLSLGNLSEREKQVVKLVADGYNSSEVGEDLGITTKTVSRHRARILDKLGLETTVGLVKFAIRTGLSKLN